MIEKKTKKHDFLKKKLGLLFLPPSRHREAGDEDVPQHPSLREHFCGGNRDLRQGLKKTNNPKAETAAPNSGANFKPYLLNSLGFQLHFKSKAFVFSFEL